MLFYLARFRAQFDSELFPSTGKGGDSPLTALAALQQQWGSVINPVVMGNPTMFAAVLARVKTWRPTVPEGYHPGWQYDGRGDEERARATMEGAFRQFLDSMNGLCTLLQDPAYFAAFRTGQDYNTLRRRFPSNITAKMFGFREYPYFDAPTAAEVAPKVDFSR